MPAYKQSMLLQEYLKVVFILFCNVKGYNHITLKEYCHCSLQIPLHVCIYPNGISPQVAHFPSYVLQAYFTRSCNQPSQCVFMGLRESPWHETACCPTSLFSVCVSCCARRSFSWALLVASNSNICILSYLFVRALSKLI